jgi:hypothetical protein
MPAEWSRQHQVLGLPALQLGIRTGSLPTPSAAARKPDFGDQRQKRRNGLPNPTARLQRPSAGRMRREFGAVRHSPGNLSEHGNAWWCAQLNTNRSQLAFPCYSLLLAIFRGNDRLLLQERDFTLHVSR